MRCEVAAGFSRIGLHDGEEGLCLREAACQEIVAPCHEGRQCDEEAAYQVICFPPRSVRGRGEVGKKPPGSGGEGEAMIESAGRGDEICPKADAYSGECKEEEGQLPKGSAIDREEECECHAGQREGGVVPRGEDFPCDGYVQTVDDGEKGKPY